MRRLRSALAGVALLLPVAMVQPAAAQGAITAPDPAANWTLDTAPPKPGRPAPKGHKTGKPASSGGLTPEQADKVARDAEARRRFFDDQDKAAAKPAAPKAPAQFGGYDAGTMTGTMRPGAGFKF